MKYCKRCSTDTDRYATGICKPCQKASVARWAAKNTDIVNASKANYRALHREKAKADSAAYRSLNYAKVNAAQKKYNARRYSVNPDKAKSVNKAWRSANPIKKRIFDQNRRALKKNAGGKLSLGLPAKLFALQKGKCVCCSKPLGSNYHLDHVTSLAKGGLNTDDNIQLLRPSCNQQKHAKNPIDFMQSRGFLI